jgi:hypothetical protein
MSTTMQTHQYAQSALPGKTAWKVNQQNGLVKGLFAEGPEIPQKTGFATVKRNRLNGS